LLNDPLVSLVHKSELRIIEADLLLEAERERKDNVKSRPDYQNGKSGTTKDPKISKHSDAENSNADTDSNLNDYQSADSKKKKKKKTKPDDGAAVGGSAKANSSISPAVTASISAADISRDELVGNLIAMGFPEHECLAAILGTYPVK
jgi:hypothetical protein